MLKDIPKPREDLLAAKDIIENWPISGPTIWRQLKAGRFPEPVRVGRKCYWPRSSVEAYFTPKSSRAA